MIQPWCGDLLTPQGTTLIELVMMTLHSVLSSDYNPSFGVGVTNIILSRFCNIWMGSTTKVIVQKVLLPMIMCQSPLNTATLRLLL